MARPKRVLETARRIIEIEREIEVLSVERERLIMSLNGVKQGRPRGNSVRSKILEMLGKKPVSTADIIPKIGGGVAPKDIRSVLSALKRAGVAKNPSRGMWVKV